MTTPITRFAGIYSFLSNFYLCLIVYKEIYYPSVEHAYQAAKTLDFDERHKIAGMRRPGQAKRYGRRVKLRLGWDSMKVDVMRDLLHEKFYNHSGLKESLLATGDATLVEENDWGDTSWGRCDGEGKNMLGKLLMETRKSLRRK
jgi:ribA/ribD-fused uncharacterized protein